MPKDDFVNVQLTDFGKEYAAGSTVQVHSGNYSFYFKPGEVQKVTRAFDWNRVLKNEHINGHALFEIEFSEEYEQEHVAEIRALGIDATETPQGIMVDTKEVGN